MASRDLRFSLQVRKSPGKTNEFDLFVYPSLISPLNQEVMAGGGENSSQGKAPSLRRVSRSQNAAPQPLSCGLLLPHHPCLPRGRGCREGSLPSLVPSRSPLHSPSLSFLISRPLSSAGTTVRHLPLPWPPSMTDSSHTCAASPGWNPRPPSYSSPGSSPFPSWASSWEQGG